MRERWIDNIRGFAIYLVVLGHSIQYASHEGYEFANNNIFKIIYSFHMPLFMLLTGYLFWYTLSKYSLWGGIMSKLKGIMIPCMVWGGVSYIIDIVMNDYSPISLYEYWDYSFYSNWFLWAVFYCSLVGFVLKYIFQCKWIGYAIVLIVNHLIPAVGNTAGAKRLLPFLVLGILINQYDILSRIKTVKTKAIVFIALCVSYLVSMLLMPEVELFTGTSGSLLVCFVFWIISDKFIYLDVLSKLGQVSIGIYVFTGNVFWFVIKEYCRISESYRYAIRLGYVFGLSVMLTLIAYLICVMLGKCKVTSLLFLGKTKPV